MCYGCYEEAGSPAIITPATQDAARLIGAVYDHTMSGGNAHIVVDDWNVEDSHIEFCLDEVDKEEAQTGASGDVERWRAERAALLALRGLIEDERISALAIHAGYLK